MNLDFSEEQETLRTSARDSLTKECPKTFLRSLEEDERGYSLAWKVGSDLPATTASTIEGPRRQSWLSAIPISQGRWLPCK